MQTRQSRRWARRCVALSLLVATACGLPIDSVLRPGLEAPRRTLRRAVWLAPVQVDDTTAANPRAFADKLTVDLRDYLRARGFFTAVNTQLAEGGVEQAKPADADVLTLRVRMKRYRMTWSAHPLYLPAAFVTATLYIWVGGPIRTYTVDLDGEAALTDAAGVTVARAASTRREKNTCSLYSESYRDLGQAFANEASTKYVDDLIERLVQDAGATL